MVLNNYYAAEEAGVPGPGYDSYSYYYPYQYHWPRRLSPRGRTGGNRTRDLSLPSRMSNDWAIGARL